MTMPGPSRLQPVSSDGYAAKNLTFKDSPQKLVQLPMNTNSFLYLGAEYMSAFRFLHKTHCYLPNCCFSEQTTGANSRAIKWCAVCHAETAKCGTWSINSIEREEP
ncbi:serotransferrin-1-like isoform 2-T2 [Salvelinus alpinus]